MITFEVNMKSVVARRVAQMRTLSAKLKRLEESKREASIGWVDQLVAIDGCCDEIQVIVGKLFKIAKGLDGRNVSKHLVSVEQLFNEVAELHDLIIAEKWWELDFFPWQLKDRLEAKCEELVPLVRARRGL